MLKTLLITVMLLFSPAVADSFNLEHAPSTTKRQMPQDSSVIFSFYDAIKDAKQSVVNIATKTVQQEQQLNSPFLNDPFFRHFFGDQFGNRIPQQRAHRALGSGVIITSNGYIVTNNHVVKDADEITVVLPNDDTEYSAKLIGTDPKTDLAVIKVEAKNLQAITFADSDTLKEGDLVFAIGNPFGVGQTTTQGIISALNKNKVGINEYENYIQTDASINPGNSGGALVDSRGALIGINTAILSKSGGNNGIGFAIPANMVSRIATSLVTDGKIKRGYLGVTISDLTTKIHEFYTSKEGALIMSVKEDSAADEAGLKRGDLIIKVNAHKVTSASDLKNIIGTISPDQKITVTYERDKKIKSISLKLSDSLDGGDPIKTTALDGLEVVPLDNDLRYKHRLPQSTQGVYITRVEPKSEAAKLGFEAGDVIIQIENRAITDIDTFLDALKDYKNRTKRVYINRDGAIFIVAVK